MELTQNRSDFHQNFGSLPELVMGLTLRGPRRGLYQICPLWGVPELRENHLGASWSTKTAKKLWSQQHMMTCLASLRHQTSKKLVPSSFTLLLGPPPAPFLIPKWCQNDVRELQIQPELLSGSHFPQLLLTIHWFIYHMEFGRALRSIKALL